MRNVTNGWRKSWLLAVCLALSACGPCSTQDITIQGSDTTPPVVTLGAGVPATNGAPAINVSVAVGGTDQTFTLHSATGNIGLVVTAGDPESGIRQMEIWLEVDTTRCTPTVCSLTQGTPGAPISAYNGPPHKPGDSVPESLIQSASVDLTQEIPPGTPPPGVSLTVTLTMWADATNYFNLQAMTHNIVATYSVTGSAAPGPLATVPNVVGDATSDAASTLRGAGFGVQIEDRADPSCEHVGYVMQETPSAGVQISAGSVIAIAVGVKPKTSNCP